MMYVTWFSWFLLLDMRLYTYSCLGNYIGTKMAHV